MTPDQLRALADALRKMRWHLMSIDDACDLEHAADYLLACADEKPVAWRVEVRWTDTSRDRGRWRKYADYATEKSALSSQQRFANPGDIESRVRSLYLHPAPAAPQAEPPRQAGQEISLGALMREQRQSRIVAGAFPDGNPAAKAMIAQTPQAEPVSDPRPCTCHPDDNPPVPCAQQYALSECRAASEPTEARIVAVADVLLAWGAKVSDRRAARALAEDVLRAALSAKE